MNHPTTVHSTTKAVIEATHKGVPNDAPYECMVFNWGEPTTVHVCPWSADYMPQWVSADGLFYKFEAPQCGTTWIEAAV